MSIPDPLVKSAKSSEINNTSTKLSAADLEDLKALDEACDRIKKSIPAKPYILTIPIDPQNEYRHYSQAEADGWRKHTLFEPHEEHLQYMSFLWREPGESLIVARTEVDEERERRQRLGINGVASGSSTPSWKSSSGPKKKITLSDYKGKLAGAKASPAKPMDKKEEVKMNGVKKEEVKVEPVDLRPQQGQKRPLDDNLEVKPPVKAPSDSQPPPKKARTTPLPPERAPKHEKPAKNPHGLPPLQSPIRVSPTPHDLPPMLSPTLPPSIESELLRLIEQGNSNSSAPSSAERPSKKHINDTSSSSIKATSSAVKNNDVLTKKPLSDSDDRRHRIDGTKPRDKEVHSLNEKALQTDRPPKKERLIVKLKYGRKRRTDVERILRLPSKGPRVPPKVDGVAKSDMRRADSSLDEDRSSRPAVRKEKTLDESDRKTTPLKKKESEAANSRPSSEKRKRFEDDRLDQPSVKRPKASTLDPERRPTTPVPPAVPSPNVGSNRSSAQKAQLNATPRKDLLVVQMVRSNSSDSNIRTPQATGGTPINSKVTSAPNGKASEIELWSSLSKKYNELGRKLKHEFTDLGRKDTTEQTRKQAAILALESLLSYILAFHCGDTSTRLAHRSCSLNNTWLSLIPLWKLVLHTCSHFPHLEGLVYHLGVVMRSAIGDILTDRINLANKEKNKEANGPPLSRNGSTDAPTPTPSASGVNSAVLPSHTLIGENWAELVRYTREASMKLSVNMMMKLFPNTWAAKGADTEKPTLGVLERDAESLITGKFFLPIGPDSTPVQGVRAGLRLLEEFMSNENVKGLNLVLRKA